MRNEVHVVVEELCRANPCWGDADSAINKCQIAANELILKLAEAGIMADERWVARPKVGGMAGQRLLHVVVLFEGEIVDMTRRQIDPAAGFPTFYSDVESLDRDLYERFDLGVHPGVLDDEQSLGGPLDV
jgi:hypothetical protein